MQAFAQLASDLALFVEIAACLVILSGAVEALVSVVTYYARRYTRTEPSGTSLAIKKAIWTHFASWLMLGLEFELAADIIRSAIAPTWSSIGQLAAIAAIRTFLNYFLERDVDRVSTGPA